MNIYNRNTYETENLKTEDFIRGIGFDNNLLVKLNCLKKSNEFDFYHEEGVSIDGTIRIKKYHPLLNQILIDSCDNDRELIVESVHKHWYQGYYWCLVYRIVGTKSHGTLFYKNINSIDTTIINGVDETINTKFFKDTTINWNNF